MGGGLKDFFCSRLCFSGDVKLDFFFHTPFQARFAFHKELKVRFLKKNSHAW